MIEEELRQLLKEASELDISEARIEKLREAVRRAEAGGHTAPLVEARVLLVHGLNNQYKSHQWATRSTKLRELAVAYGRCHALYKKAPEYFSVEDSRSVRSFTINVTLHLLRSADHPTATLRKYLQETEAFWPANQHYLYGSAALRMELEGLAGDFAAARAAMDRLHTLDPGYWDQAYIHCCWARHLSSHERDEEAITVLESILAGEIPSGNDSAARPPVLRSLLLLPYLRTGRHAQAQDLYRLLPEESNDEWSERFEFLARSGNEDIAAKALRESGFPLVPLEEVDYDLARFYSAVSLVCRRLIELGRADEGLKVESGDGVDSGTMTAAELYRACTDISLAFARKADACHGNTYQSDRVHAIINAEPLVDHLPLDDTGTGGTATEPEPNQ
jgi:tetratricopeptide (TPR) repeat protein